MWYQYALDFPRTDKFVKDQIFLTIQGWIASDKSIKNIHIRSKHTIALKEYPRPDVTSIYPEKYVTGFKCQLNPEDIVHLPDKPKILFETGSEKKEISIDPNVIRKYKKIAKHNIILINKIKNLKLKRIKPYLICPICKGNLIFKTKSTICKSCGSSFPYNKHSYNFLTPDLRQQFSIIDTNNISSHGYGGVIDNLITSLKNGLILDCGAGSKDFFLPNVVNLEIVDYLSTDILAVGEKLPFKDNTFDAVLSFAVLEHVKDPFLCAQEIIRVLKPDGKLMCQVPFLQPYHGYPHHYYNMTETGLINLFKELTVESCYVPHNGHPIFTLSWFLNTWCNGLTEKNLKQFKNLQIKDLLDPGQNYLEKPYVKNLSQDTQKIIASVNFLIATKPKL